MHLVSRGNTMELIIAIPGAQSGRAPGAPWSKDIADFSHSKQFECVIAALLQ